MAEFSLLIKKKRIFSAIPGISDVEVYKASQIFYYWIEGVIFRNAFESCNILRSIALSPTNQPLFIQINSRYKSHRSLT